MATKQELVGGLEFMIREAKRIGSRFDNKEWAGRGDDGGWTSKQVIGHVAGIGGIATGFIEQVANAPEGVDAGAGVNINTINAGLVGQRDAMPGNDVVDQLLKSYGQVIEWVRATPDALFEKRATLGGYKNMTVSDIMMQAIVMHGIQHLYRAASRFP